MKDTKVNHSKLVDLASGRLPAEEVLEILDKLEHDPEASEELDLIVALMDVSKAEGANIFEGAGYRVPETHPRWRQVLEGTIEGMGRKKIAFGLAGAAVLIAGLFLSSSITTSKYLELAEQAKPEFDIPLRGPAAEDFTQARQLFVEGKYDESIRTMERHIRAFPQGDLVDFAHYVAGATYLASSRKSYLTLFPSFDADRVRQGMSHLELAITTSTNIRVIEDARWLRAAGYLMLGRPQEAVDELHAVASLNGVKKEEALRLASRIEDIQKGG